MDDHATVADSYGTYEQIIAGASVTHDVFGIELYVSDADGAGVDLSALMTIGLDPTALGSYTDFIQQVVMLVGLIILMHRRFTEPRIRATTTTMDWVVLWLLAAQLALGLVSLYFSWQHRDGAEMIKLMTWAQHLVTLRTDAASYIVDVAPVFKQHLLLA